MEDWITEKEKSLEALSASSLFRSLQFSDELIESLADIEKNIEKMEAQFVELAGRVTNDEIAITLNRHLFTKLADHMKRIDSIHTTQPPKVNSLRPTEPSKKQATISTHLPKAPLKQKQSASISSNHVNIRDSSVAEVPNNSSAATLSLNISQLHHITEAEFETIPSYIKGRLLLQRVNEAIDELNKIFTEKYKILRMNSTKMSEEILAKYRTFKKSESDEVLGKPFICDLDIKNGSSNFKMDNLGKAVLIILRHLGKLKEVRGGGFIRYVIVV